MYTTEIIVADQIKINCRSIILKKIFLKKAQSLLHQ